MQQTLEAEQEEHRKKEENDALAAKSQLESIQILVSEKTELASTVTQLQKEMQNLKGENVLTIRGSRLGIQNCGCKL